MRDLRPLFDPRSVAVVGASSDPAKWGHWLARGALRGVHRRDVFLVNKRGGEVLGKPTYASLAALPAAPELVVLAVPAAVFEETVDEALAAGARAIVAISAGLGESGEAGRTLEAAVVERVRAAGAVLLGPNCNGLCDAAAEVELGLDGLAPGPVGFISQSGNLCYEVAQIAADAGLGLSRVASIGNQADLDAAALVESFATDPHTRVIAAYVEDFRDGRAFARAAQASATPVVLLAAGSSEAGQRAALSHTGALVSASAAIDAACRAAGIVRVGTPRELVDAAQLLLAPHRPTGRRVAVVGDGGGTGVIAADVASGVGLDLPQLSDTLRKTLAADLPATSSTANPVDLAGAGEQDFGSYARVVGTLLGSGEVDTVLLVGYLGGYTHQSDELAQRELEVARSLAAAARDSGRPLLCQLMYADAPPAQLLRAEGVPVYREIERALGALARVAMASNGIGRDVPEYATTQSGIAKGEGYLDARRLIETAGVPLAECRAARTTSEVLGAADEIGYPIVLKALGLLHKSDAGGVALGLADAVALQDAHARMEAALSPEGYAVERMVQSAGAVELIVGCRRDPRFGPLVLVGLGGVYAEVLQDVAVTLAPAEPDELEELILSLRGASLLTGARGRAPVDVPAVARAAAALSRLAATCPEIAEVEVNPLLATPDGAIGLDARVVLTESSRGVPMSSGASHGL
ncbi:MAG: acetate--CoA ligase family protein, partial [Gaiellaceae bacterium]